MGISLLITGRRNIKMMKIFAIVLLAAVAYAEPEAKAAAEADPYLLYGGYGHHLGYAGYYGHGLRYYGKRSAEAEPGYGYYGHGYGHFGYGYGFYGKRSADAEPKAEADPYLLYGGYGYGH